jgi:pimeloyl-ACP methyl ester carboxylesterase
VFLTSNQKSLMKRSLLRVTALTLAIMPAALLLHAANARSVPFRPVALAPLGGVPSAFANWRLRNAAALTGSPRLVKTWTIHYRAHDGAVRIAFVVLPRWYGPRKNPRIPLVISPHGRGVEPGRNARLWGNLPALGRFAVVNPEGQGNRLELYSWGSSGEISDLARMPVIVRRGLPWLRIAPHRVYAVGGSMGGQETLLLVAEHPRLLVGAVAFDAPTNMAARYAAFPKLKNGHDLQELARLEFGGVPRARHDAWADRSPIYYSRELATSGVPLQIWWSTRDRIVINQAHESGLLYRAIKRLNPRAPVVQVVGTWRHTAEMHPTGRMPLALAWLGLLHIGTTGVYA